MIHTLPDFKAPVQALFGLANSPFDADIFRENCLQFAAFDPSLSDESYWRFSTAGSGFIVGVDDARIVRTAVLSVCWWETYRPADHPDGGSFEAENDEFNRNYSRELEAASTSLGVPRFSGQDKLGNQHRWAIWRGRTGLLTLQQSAYDPQFGFDINYWLCPWSGDDPRPGDPFIDWLLGIA